MREKLFTLICIMCALFAAGVLLAPVFAFGFDCITYAQLVGFAPFAYVCSGGFLLVGTLAAFYAELED